jgi:hypothetical protein
MPEPIRVAWDAASRADLQAAWTGWADCTDQWGFDHAVRALEEAVTWGRIAYTDILTMGRRLALAPIPQTAPPVDLRPFDVLLRRSAP